MFRFLLSRRWLVFGLVVVALALACWRLGEWQFHRLQERRADNAVIERNLDHSPADPRDVMSTDHPLPDDANWRQVTMRGHYLTDEQVLVRYQTRDGQPGVDIVVPFELDDGTLVLVDRGWAPTTNNASTDIDVPDPPAGTVTVTGWARPDQGGGDQEQAITPTDGQVRLISSRGFTHLRDRLLQGYVSAEQERPAPQTGVVRAAAPELNNGPHFFYGLQWWFFGVLAVAGFGWFAWVEARERRQAR